ncbi:hypothetical protein [Phenylobacterium sp.]|uniref:hypothetical protein n=1 Tax=Phenylobacterium sp. TaxID=1871053 RepID=UPI0027339D72|nr:hypothetical protein [Phenylobacterium sp.]MDP3660148.1 hypothetical protein [Phenylobacterium sp.]
MAREFRDLRLDDFTPADNGCGPSLGLTGAFGLQSRCCRFDPRALGVFFRRAAAVEGIEGPCRHQG